MDAKPLFELSKVLEITGGEKDIALEIVQTFLDDTPKQIDNFLEARESTNWELLERISHSLKSSSAYAGCEVLSELCREMEYGAKSKDLQKIDELFPLVKRNYQAYTQEVQNHF